MPVYAEQNPYCQCGEPFRFRTDLIDHQGGWVHSVYYWCPKCDALTERAVNERESNGGR